MVFTSLIFLFVFFPFFIICYYFSLLLSKKGLFVKFRLPDICLILLSLAFVAWAGLKGAFAFVFLIIGVYIFGKVLAVCKQKGKRWGQAAALFGVLFVLGGLYLFKYATYVSQLINEKFGLAIAGSPVWTILGISFVSFSAISYIVDIYRGGANWKSSRCCIIFVFFSKSYFGTDRAVEGFSTTDQRARGQFR